MSQRHSRSREQTGAETTTEDLHLRNYDMETAHNVWINVVDDGEQVLETTCHLRPDEACPVTDAVPPGEYDIEVGIDGLRREVEHCRIDETPEQTALIEVGNGVVSITQGIN